MIKMISDFMRQERPPIKETSQTILIEQHIVIVVALSMTIQIFFINLKIIDQVIVKWLVDRRKPRRIMIPWRSGNSN